MKPQLFIAAALLVGVAIGYCAKPQDPPPAPAEKAVPAGKAMPADKGAAATIAALRARIADLEARLAADVQRPAPAPTNVPAAAAQVRAPQDGWRQHIENMKKNHPEQYAQMTNRMAQFRQRRLEHAQSRIDFLSSLDVSRMSASARKTHEELQAMIERREEIESRLHQPDLSGDDRRALFEEIMQTERELERLNRRERENLLKQTAADLGLKGAEAAELTATVKEIIEATEGMRWRPSRNGRRRR